MPSLQARLLKGLLRLNNRFSGSREDLDIGEERKALEKLARGFNNRQHAEHTPVSINGLLAEWIVPQHISPGRTILYLHGGSYVAGSINSHRSIATSIAISARARALIIEYRLAPEFPFPAAIEDAKSAYDWLRANGISPKEIIFVGDSAGGGLALALLNLINLKADTMPAMAICLSPWIDLTEKVEPEIDNSRKDAILNAVNLKKAAKLYLEKEDPKNPLASPIYAELKNLPPILIQVGSDEILLSDSINYANLAKDAGVDICLEIWDDMQHVWQFAGNLVPESRKAISSIGNFIEKRYQ
jgi:monoterpene epsilon-lactone hydrolase